MQGRQVLSHNDTLHKQYSAHFRSPQKVCGNALLVFKHFCQDAVTIGQMSVCQKTIGQIRDTLVFHGDILGWYWDGNVRNRFNFADMILYKFCKINLWPLIL
jgi:hypothetical protein